MSDRYIIRTTGQTGPGAAAGSVTVTPTGGIAATNLQSALAELDSEKATVVALNAHIDDTSDAHDASAISFSATGNLSATDVQAAIAELDSEKAAVAEPIAAAHIADTSDAHDASAISVLDTAGNYTATDVEAVLAELPSRFAPAVFTVDSYLPAGVTPSTATSAQTLAAYNSARDAAFAVGGTVKFTPGRTYQIDDTFIVKSAMTFDCTGATLRKRSTSGKNTPLIMNETWSGSGNPGITVIAHGATWDFNGRNTSGGTGEPGGALGDMVHFQRTPGLRIIGRPTCLDASKYAICIGNSNNIDIDGAHFDTRSDGIHLYPPMRNAHFGTFSGTTGDDFFAMTISDYSTQVANLTANGETVSVGDFVDITIDTLAIANEAMPTGGASTGSGLSMLSGNGSYRFDRIHVGQILGKTKKAFRLTNDGILTATKIGAVTIDKIDATLGSGAPTLCSTDCTELNSLTIGELVNGDTGATTVLSLGGVVDSVRVGRFIQLAGCTGGLIAVPSGGTIKSLHIGSMRCILGTNGRPIDLGNATATYIAIDQFDLSGAGGWGMYANGAGPHLVQWGSGVMRGIGQAARVDSPAVVHCSFANVLFDTNTAHLTVNTGATLRMTYGNCRQVATSDRTLSGSGTLSCSGPQFRVATAAIANPQTGDIVFGISQNSIVQYSGATWVAIA